MNRSQWIAFYNDSYFPLKKRGYTNNVFLSCVNKAKERNHIFLFFYSFFFFLHLFLCVHMVTIKRRNISQGIEKEPIFDIEKEKLKYDQQLSILSNKVHISFIAINSQFISSIRRLHSYKKISTPSLLPY